MFRLTHPVHKIDHVVKIKSLLDRHIRLLESTAHEMDVYLSRTLPRHASDSPESIEAVYTGFVNLANVLCRLLSEFSANLAPIVRHAKDTLADRTAAGQALDAYESKMARVRRQPDDASRVTEERDALLAFVECLRRLNVRANTFCETLHPTYGDSCRRLVGALEPVLESFGGLAVPTEESDEERELAAYLAELRQTPNGM
jgi:hypothetical protein